MGGWTLEQWLAGFEQNVEGYVRQTLETARRAQPEGDAGWVELRSRYGVSPDPLLARWVASLDPSRRQGASAEELRQVLEALAGWARRELAAFVQQAPGALAHPAYRRLDERLTRMPLDEVARYRDALAARFLPGAAPGAAPAVNSIFANAARTAGETPWAATYHQGAQANTLICPYCGGAQERPLDFLCRYCKKPMG